MKGLSVEKQNPSRRTRRLSLSRRFKLQGLGVVPNGTCFLTVRSFPANAPNIVATHSGKLTQKDNADSRMQFITLVGPRESLLLVKDPDQFFVKTLHTLSVCAQTHLPKFSETSLNKGKERYNQS